jgi:ABC-type nickel/cobalt efflux system permease component RcnA
VSRTLRRSLLFVAVLSIAVAAWPAGAASAHPLGNFTINVYVGIVVRPEAVIVDYVVDMAEIPAFREHRTIDANLDDQVDDAEALAYRETMCATLADHIVLRAGQEGVSLAPTGLHALTFPNGTGGLSTLRLECRLAGALVTGTTSTAMTVTDRNFAEAIGWREVTAVGDGVTLTSSDVPAVSATERLLSYPSDQPSRDVRSASLEAVLGGPRLSSLPGPGSGSATTNEGRDGGLLSDLVGRDDLTPLLVGAMLLVALGIGALHALGPGHGKTLIGAYLVGAGGSVRHAVGVGAAVSVMHTASVLTLGLLVLSAERVFAPERVYPVLGVASGCIALGLGATLLVSRIHAMAHGGGSSHHDHDAGNRVDPHDHGHQHPHSPHGSSSTAGSPLSRRGLLALAFSGGILPSPSALVVLLASVTLGRTVLGLVLIVAFSLGLAGALIGVGILTLRARDIADRRLTTSMTRLLPVGSAAAISAIGMFLTVRGVSQL